MDTNGYIVGIDIGGTANKFTVIDGTGRFLIDRLVELPSRVTEGPDVAIPAMRQAYETAIEAGSFGTNGWRGTSQSSTRRVATVRARGAAAACLRGAVLTAIPASSNVTLTVPSWSVR